VEHDLLGALREMLGERYRIDRELGGGGMSRLFLAMEEPLARAVVIKVLPPDLACRASIARFEREVALTVQLQHPHILPLLTAGGRDDVRFHVTPYLSSETLRARLTRGGALPPREAVRLLCELADAVAYAHGHGVVHRDIKPENILLSGGHAVLADFGIARALTSDDGYALTAPDARPGTLPYMPPEPEPDERGDVFALAVVGWEMLTGSRPSPGVPFASDAEAVRGVATLAAVPPALRAVLVRGMAPDPERRYRTAAAFQEALVALPPFDDVAPRPPRVRRWLALGGLAATLAAATLAAARWGRPSGGGPWEDDLVAVAPFEALGPDVRVWSEGLMDVTAQNLDGAGPLRVVPVTTALSAWSGRPDLVTARRLAGRTRARFVVYGTLMPKEDSVRLRASVLDARTGRTITSVDLTDGVRNVDRLGDSLTIGVLQALAQRRPIVAVRLRQASLGTRSFAAYKSFLAGEQQYRANRLDSARFYYEHAIRKDSAFALPYLRMRSVLRAGDENDSLSMWFARRAAERNRGLSRRDSLLVLADSLLSGVKGVPRATPGWHALIRRRLAVLAQLTTLYPDDPEGWHELGEARVHFGESAGIDEGQALAAFSRSLTLDPAFRPAYFHVVELSFRLNDSARAHRYIHDARRAGSSDSSLALIDRLLEAPRGATDLRFVDTLPLSTVSRAAYLLRLWPDSAEWAAQLYERAYERAHVKGTTFTDSLNLRQFLLVERLYRGHGRRVRSAFDAAPPEGIRVQHLILFGFASGAAADSVVARWLSSADVRQWTYALPVLGRRGDRAALLALARVGAACRGVPPNAPAAPLAAYCASAADAWAALARRDTAAALRAFAAIPDSACPWWCTVDRVTHARLLAATGRDVDAARVLDGHPPFPDTMNDADVLWRMERARVAERLGDRARAAEHYAFVTALWRLADPELQPFVAEARAGAARVAVR
jgi:serine/threonine-protein kinase